MHEVAEMKRVLALALFCAAAMALAADPYVGYIYPCGIQAGTTNRLIVGGQAFSGKGTCQAVVSGEGVKVLSIEMVPNFPNVSGSQFRYLAKWLDGIAAGDRTAPPLPTDPKAHVDEWRSNRWWQVLGELDPQKISIVERAIYIRRNPLQATPSLNQRMLVTVAAAPDAKPGAREFRVFGPNGISAPRPLIVTAAPHEEEALYAPSHRPLPPAPAVTNLPCVLDGQIMPGETDAWTLYLRKGRTVTLRTVARELQPYIGDAVPGFFNPSLTIFNPWGKEVAFADDNFFHPDSVLVFTPPADGDYKLEIHDVLYRGRSDFVYAITVEEGAHPVNPRKVSLWPNPVPNPPDAAATRVFNGVVSRLGVAVVHDFTVEKPGKYTLDLLARRAGSPLDGRVTILRHGSEKPVAVFNDATNTVFRGTLIQAECDPVGTCSLASGNYTLRVEDEAGRGGAEWSYALRVYPSAPSFEVWSSKSSFSFKAKTRSFATVFHVVRHGGFNGPVKLLETEDFKFVPEVIPAGTNSMKIAIYSKNPQSKELHDVGFRARAQVNGRPVTVEVHPADVYNQAFAWDHLLPARSFVVRTTPNAEYWKRLKQQQQKRQSLGVKPKDKPKNMPKPAKEAKP